MSSLSVSASISFRKLEPALPPAPGLPAGTWGQALHDYERAEYYRADLGYSVPRSLIDPKDKLSDAKGFPEMTPLAPRIGVKLTKRLQWFWVKLLVLSKYGILLVEEGERTFESEFKRLLTAYQQDYIKNAWRGLTKSYTAFTNGRGTDNCRDYINGVNLSKSEEPILWENTCGGSLLRLEGDRIYRDGYKVFTLKTEDYPIWKNWIPSSHPGYFTEATNSTPFGFDGAPTISGPWRVDPFHYLGGNPVYVPIMSNSGEAYIRPDRVRILKSGDRFPPKVYNP